MNKKSWNPKIKNYEQYKQRKIYNLKEEEIINLSNNNFQCVCVYKVWLRVYLHGKYHLQLWNESLFINATWPPIMLEKEILRWSHHETKTIIERKSKHQLKAQYLIKEKEFTHINTLLFQTWGVKYPRFHIERSNLESNFPSTSQ